MEIVTSIFSDVPIPAAAIILIILAVIIFTKPIRLILKVVINTVLGFAALWLINTFGAPFGLEISLTWIHAAVVGVLGLPGVAALLILSHFGINI